MLLRLKKNLDHAVGLRHRKIPGYLKYRGHATVCGYGRWPDADATLNGVDGLQRRFRVDLGLPLRDSEREREWIPYDNLDLMWASSRNGGLAAGRGNSGGPILWGANGSFDYVGVNRERRRRGPYDLQLGSWIGRDRKEWLDGSVEAPAPQSGFLAREALTVTVSRAEPQAVQVKAPVKARRLRCTLNAGSGLPLQMRLFEGKLESEALSSLAHDNRASGRFLHRELDLSNDGAEVSIGVAAVARAPFQAEQTVAQVCCLFL